MLRMLHPPYETRSATNFYMVESLLWSKNIVVETFVCAHFFEWEVDQNQLVKGKITILRDNIAKKMFWDEVEVMMPIILAF